jgi:hypothetical protein
MKIPPFKIKNKKKMIIMSQPLQLRIRMNKYLSKRRGRVRKVAGKKTKFR